MWTKYGMIKYDHGDDILTLTYSPEIWPRGHKKQKKTQNAPMGRKNKVAGTKYYVHRITYPHTREAVAMDCDIPYRITRNHNRSREILVARTYVHPKNRRTHEVRRYTT